ncbi:MAG: 30S ribosome-binding factor RbfA [Muribaculaceae bacterium]|jgi:ribosome-binding factor A|nr:30S ribosome-binding factor RbfA [Muribaculaceae bacterium]
MEGKRQAKIARYIQKELSEIFRKQTAKLGGVLVTVSAVRVTPDLSIAKAYLSIFPPEKAAEILENVRRQSKTVRYDLAQAVRQTLRKCPDLQFYPDDSLDYIDNIDRLLAADKSAHPAAPAGDAPEAE